MVTVEQHMREFLQQLFPSYRVQAAPTFMGEGAGRLIVIRANHTPFNGLMGRASIVTFTVYNPEGAAAVMQTADELVQALDAGITDGSLTGISALRFVTLPELVVNPSNAEGTAVAEVACQTWGRYMYG